MYFFLLYNFVLVLPYFNINLPWVYMCSQSWTPLPLPPHTISLGHPSAPAPSILYPASNLDWRFISYMNIIHVSVVLPYTQSRRRQWQPTPVLLLGKSHGRRSLVACSPWSREESNTTEQCTFTFHFHALEKEMATHSSILAWRIPGIAEPDGLPSMGSHRVGHDWSDLAAAAEQPVKKLRNLTFVLFQSLLHSISNQPPNDKYFFLKKFSSLLHSQGSNVFPFLGHHSRWFFCL